MTDRKWSWIFGYCLLASVVGLGGAFAMGKVVEATSYGLHEVLLVLGLLASNWSNGMWNTREKKDEEKHD